MSDDAPDGDARDGGGGPPGRPPSRVAVALAGAVALLLCAFWLSCHEATQPDAAPRDPAQPNVPR